MTVKPAAGTARPRVSTIDKVGTLLALFTPRHAAWRLTDLAQTLEWDMATTLRLANALVDIRLLTRGADDRYQLGPYTAELGAVYLGMDPRREELLQLIESTAQETGLTTQLAVLSGARVVIRESAEGAGALKAAAMLGERLPLHATAGGKAMLAELTPEKVAELIGPELEVFTPRTHATLASLEKELAEVRKTGFAYANGELAHGLYAAATVIPVYRGGRELTAFTCVGPSPEIQPEPWTLVEQILESLRADQPSRSVPSEAGR